MSNSFLPTPAHQMVPKHPRRQRKVLTGLLVATGAAMVFLPLCRADAFLFDIVLDPIALVENVLKVVDLGEQIDAVVQQVENQVKELEHLNLMPCRTLPESSLAWKTNWSPAFTAHRIRPANSTRIIRRT